MSLGTILLIVLVIALLGGFSGLGGGPFYGTGYYGGGGLGLILIVVLVLVLLGRLELRGQCPRLKSRNVLRWYDLAHHARSDFHQIDDSIF